MTILAFVDTETTALGHLARPWEIAVIKRNDEEPTVPDGEWLFHVDYTFRTLPAGTQRQALQVGRWTERSGLAGAEYREQLDHLGVMTAAGAEWTIAQSVHELLTGTVLIGAGPHFDAAHLSSMFRRHGLPEEPWHYAILDLKAMAYGHAVARGLRPSLPLQSDQLVRETGGPTTSKEDRHTALGDARWAAAWWDHLHTAQFPY